MLSWPRHRICSRIDSAHSFGIRRSSSALIVPRQVQPPALSRAPTGSASLLVPSHYRYCARRRCGSNSIHNPTEAALGAPRVGTAPTAAATFAARIDPASPNGTIRKAPLIDIVSRPVTRFLTTLTGSPLTPALSRGLERAHPGIIETFASERWGTYLQAAAVGFSVKPDARGFRVPVDFLPSGSVVLYNMGQLVPRDPDARFQNLPRPAVPFLVLCGDGAMRPLAPAIAWELREHYPELEELDYRCCSPKPCLLSLDVAGLSAQTAPTYARRFIRGSMVDRLGLTAPNARCYFVGLNTRFYEFHDLQGGDEALAAVRATQTQGSTGAAMSQRSHIWVTGELLPEYVRVQIFGGPHAAAAQRFTSHVWYTPFHVNQLHRVPLALAQPFCIKKYPAFCGSRPAEDAADTLCIYNEEQLAESETRDTIRDTSGIPLTKF